MRPLPIPIEAVEKVPKQIFGRGAEKSDVIECATINDLMLGGQETPENHPLIAGNDFFYRLVRPSATWLGINEVLWTGKNLQ